eukprot:309353-Amphidinium_carterae.1
MEHTNRCNAVLDHYHVCYKCVSECETVVNYATVHYQADAQRATHSARSQCPWQLSLEDKQYILWTALLPQRILPCLSRRVAAQLQIGVKLIAPAKKRSSNDTVSRTALQCCSRSQGNQT